jgi:hypothetical protein
MEGDQRLAVQDVIILYGHLLDSGQQHRVAAEIFTEDAVIDHGGAPVAGRAAIAAFFAGFDMMLGTSHNISNFIVRLEGATARCQSHCLAWHWLRQDGGLRQGDGAVTEIRAADVLAVGGYQDELRREQGQWRIAHRRMLSFGTGLGVGALAPALQPLFQSMLGRAPDWP